MSPDSRSLNPPPLGVLDLHDFVEDASLGYLDRLETALGPVAGPIVVAPLYKAQLGVREMVDLLRYCTDKALRRLNKTAHEPLSEQDERALGEAVAQELQDALDKSDPYLRLRAVLEQALRAASGDPLRHAMLCRMIDDLDATRVRSTVRA